MGAYSLGNDREAIEENRRRVFELFPRLEERKNQVAGTLSGGEQQMLSIGRALMARPRLLMLDEPSLGLAPMLVRAIFETIKEINEGGVTVLLVEQNARAALRLADKGYVLETGRIVLSGTAEELMRDERVRKAYLGEE
jgi:branched-chain amino acid transport system ATP-binding protein